MHALCSSLLSTRGGYGLAVLRIVVGLTFMAHGSQKLFGLFGGYGLAGTGQWLESVGIAPGYFMALLAGSGEFFGRVTTVGNQAVFTACTVFFEKCLPLIVQFPGVLARERGSVSA